MTDEPTPKTSEPAEEKEGSARTDEETNPKRHGSEVHGDESTGVSADD